MVERWAGQQRASLLRLAVTLRTTRAELELAGAGDAPAVAAPPEEYLAAVDAVLANGAKGLQAQLEAALDDASRLVASAHATARRLLAASGSVASPTGGWRAPEWQEPPAPRPARHLWHELVCSDRYRAENSETVLDLVGTDTHRDEPDRVYEMFWGRAGDDRPRRARFRRATEGHVP